MNGVAGGSAMSIVTAPLLIALGLAFLGGLLSFLSPCVLPLAPAYLGRLTGATLRGDEPPSRSALLGRALAFVIGFATIFTAAGIAADAFISSLQAGRDVLRVVGGVAVIVMGLHVAGIITISFLYREVKLDGGAVKSGSLLGSFLIGVFFAAGWSPCVGALLTGIFALAATQSAQAGLLFFAYSIGLGVPFIVAALVLERAWRFAPPQPPPSRALLGQRSLPGARRRAAADQHLCSPGRPHAAYRAARPGSVASGQ